MTAIEHIQQLLNDYPATAHARRTYLPKASGDMRPIAHPNKDLMTWLRAMNKALQRQFNAWPNFMHGGIERRSIASYALPHINRQCVITIDIKSCFDTITEQEVGCALARHLNLNSVTCAQLARRLCFRGCLAQGYPTSNYLCNLYLLQSLSEAHAALHSQGIRFGNYVDDVVVSGNITNPHDVVNTIAVTLSRARLKMNKAKVRVMPRSGRQQVCGLIVNKRLNLTRALKVRLFAEIACGAMSKECAEGWLAHLKNIDPDFQQKLYYFACKKGLLS